MGWDFLLKGSRVPEAKQHVAMCFVLPVLQESTGFLRQQGRRQNSRVQPAREVLCVAPCSGTRGFEGSAPESDLISHSWS